MALLNYEDWKNQIGLVENKNDILILTEESHGRDARDVIEDHLKQIYNDYVSQHQGGE
jgi:hypothetical protein